MMNKSRCAFIQLHHILATYKPSHILQHIDLYVALRGVTREVHSTHGTWLLWVTVGCQALIICGWLRATSNTKSGEPRLANPSSITCSEDRGRPSIQLLLHCRQIVVRVTNNTPLCHARPHGEPIPLHCSIGLMRHIQSILQSICVISHHLWLTNLVGAVVLLVTIGVTVIIVIIVITL